MSVLSKVTGIHIGGRKAPKNVPIPSTVPVGAPTYGGQMPAAPYQPGPSPLGIGTGGSSSPFGRTPGLPGLPSVGHYLPGPEVGTTSGGAGGGQDESWWRTALGYVWDGVKWVAKNPEIPLAIVGAIQAANAGKQSSEYTQQAIDLSKQQYADRQPLREAGMAALTRSAANPVSPLQAVGGYVDHGNPYTQAPSSTGLGAMSLGAGGGAGGVPGQAPQQQWFNPPPQTPGPGTFAGAGGLNVPSQPIYDPNDPRTMAQRMLPTIGRLG